MRKFQHDCDVVTEVLQTKTQSADLLCNVCGTYTVAENYDPTGLKQLLRCLVIAFV